MTSDVSKFIRMVDKISKSIKEKVDDRLPRKLGVLAVLSTSSKISETQDFAMEVCIFCISH